ncbi:MAG TPA: PIG-L family deacetylase [Terriglobales bacterium]|nr:PIG-L family deacetylase [Terriglobales bacterium]
MAPVRKNNNPLFMTDDDRGVLHQRIRPGSLQLLLALLPILLVTVAAVWQTAAKPASAKEPQFVNPLPQDTGAAGLQEMLLRLRTTARLMQTVAHPDDEDGGMLTLESRGKGATVLLLTLNRGEGGQNKVGSNLFDVLGVLRTLELLGADRYYGVQQRFTRVADFGFSKNADETFQKWQGHDIALGDIVRVIRTFRPDVLVARFSGTDRDGHGHHQASSILTREAFRAAADRNRFPEQIAEGLLPWQANKLYIGNVCGFGAQTCPAENYTVRLNTGEQNPRLGMSYAQFALEGLRHQQSQGVGTFSIDPGPRYTYYKLVDSVLPATTDKDGHEQDFFDGIDTSLPGLAARLGAEESKVPWLRSELVDLANRVQEAAQRSEKDSSDAAGPLLAALQNLDSLTDRVQSSQISPPLKEDLLQILHEKLEQAQTAINLAMNVTLEATVAPPQNTATLLKEEEALTTVSPGQKFLVRVKFHNGSKNKLVLDRIRLDAPQGWAKQIDEEAVLVVAPGKDQYANFVVQIPVQAADGHYYTRPYWHRSNPETESINTIDDERYVTLPFPPPPLHATVQYHTHRSPHDLTLFGGTHELGGTNGPATEISSPVVAQFMDDNGVERSRTLAIVPAFSVMLEPGQQVIPTAGDGEKRVKVAVSSNLSGGIKGNLHLEVPAGWSVEPAKLATEFHKRGEKQEFEFKISPASLKEGRANIRAVFESGGVSYTEGYSLVTREDLDSFYYYQPALQRISIVDVKVPKDLTVGYVMGAGDDIPTVLTQIGMKVALIPADKLASQDLSQYQTIVVGIRAYDTQKDIAANNKKLLDFVFNGGTLVAQYETGVADFNKGKFTPYPAQLSRIRVSVEEAPVEILAPEDGIFHYPNQITERDFDGWVQERGLYFMDQWDSNFKPLLASHDPGESPQKGGLLRAQYRKGTYIYTGYAFFRQLPAGVPGAIRLYVNLLSAGHEKNSGQ